MTHEALYYAFDYVIVWYTLPPGLKLSWVIWVTRVNWVMFYLGQAGTSDPNIRVWPGFCIVFHVLIMASGPDQSNELNMLDVGDEIVCPDFLHILKDWLYN